MKKTPLKVISEYFTESVPNPCTKCCMNIASGIDSSGLDKASRLYLNQAAPRLISEVNNIGQWEESEA
jgi:hypothetical protein